MISKQAVTNFLNRPLRNLSFLKRISERKIDEAIRKLNPLPEFFTVPKRHQKVTFLIGATLPGMLEFLDMGLGKTKITLDLIHYFRKKNHQQDRALVLVPNTVGIENWRREVNKHRPDLPFYGLDGMDGEDKKAIIKSFDGILCMTYMGLLRIVCVGKEKKLVVAPKQLKDFAALFNILVLDESSSVMNIHSLSYRVCRKISKGCQHRFALTGTPFGRDYQAMWSQFYAIDHGEALGETLGLFREAFYDQKPGYWGGFEYTFRKKMFSELRRMMSHSSIYYGSDECNDLPEKSYIQVSIVLNRDARASYLQLIEQVREARGNLVLLESSYTAMRQVTSGYSKVMDVETGKFSFCDFRVNPKMEACIQLVLSLPENEKVVIFNHFLHSGDLLAETFKKLKIRFARLCSQTKNRVQQLRRFLEDPKCRLFIVSCQSGALSLNLQVARYVIFYETTDSPIVRAQAEKRCHRPGQERKVFIYDLCVVNSIDEKIQSYLKEGKSFMEALIAGEDSL